jgi:hypothetical protein
MYPQEVPSTPSPQVRVNVVNVCTPGDPEKAEIAAAVARIPEHPVFGPDFEVARGRTTVDKTPSDWVRLRREFVPDSGPSNVQFLFTAVGKGVDETLVFHLKASKPGDAMQISLQNEVTAGTPAEVLNADTPPNRVRLERYGKSSLILARCPDADQHAYESLFRVVGERFARYRTALGVRATVGAELMRLKPAAPAGKKTIK